MSYDENTLLRKRLYGKKATGGDFAKFVAKRLIGDPAHNVEPMGNMEIMRELGFKDKKSIANLKKLAIQMGLLELDEKGNPIIPKKSAVAFRKFSENHPITTDPLVQSWMDAMKFRGHTGKGRKDAKNFVLKIEQICNALKIQPIQLTMGVKQTEDYAQAFYNMLESGEYKAYNTSRKNSSSLMKWYQYRMALRSFVIQNGISLPKGHGGILSGKVLGHGQYADLKITEDQLHKVDSYLTEKFGLDSDFYRVIMFGLETGARKTALLNALLEWTETTDDGEVTFYMNVFESKTEHIKGGKIDKFIQRTRTQEALKLAKDKGYSKLWDSKNLSLGKFYAELCEELKLLYKYLKLTSHYWYEKPVHALRHIACHYWLRLTDYDYMFVSEIIGITVQELKKSYGEMPPEIKFKKLKQARKRAEEI